jgi:GH35 family endo-1,4-beta-xylanase
MSPLLSGNTRTAGALITGMGIQRHLKLQLGFCNKKQGFYRFLTAFFA